MEPSRLRDLSPTAICLLSCFLLITLATKPSHAAEPSARTIDSGWQFRAVANTDRADVKEWHPAHVPGVVQTDLLNSKLIPDPFDRDNEFHLQWIGLADWEYQTTFQVDAATQAHDHIDLVFDGLDTFADVYLNDQSVLHADNMFRRWRVPAKAMLKSGPNTLRIVFHSAVEKMIPYAKSQPFILPSISTHNYGNEENIATAPYTRKAPYNYGWDWGPRFMTEGIWQPVRLETWDALRIDNFHIHQHSITTDLANVTAELDIDASKPTTATLALAHDELMGPQDLRRNPDAATQCGHEPCFVSLAHRIAEALVSSGIWRSEPLPIFCGDPDRQRACRSRRNQDGITLCRDAPRSRSVGKELRICGEWNCCLRQRRGRDSI